MNYECYVFDTMEEMGYEEIPTPLSHIKSFAYVKETNMLYIYDNDCKYYCIFASYNTISNECVLCSMPLKEDIFSIMIFFDTCEFEISTGRCENFRGKIKTISNIEKCKHETLPDIEKIYDSLFNIIRKDILIARGKDNKREMKNLIAKERKLLKPFKEAFPVKLLYLIITNQETKNMFDSKLYNINLSSSKTFYSIKKDYHLVITKNRKGFEFKLYEKVSLYEKGTYCISFEMDMINKILSIHKKGYFGLKKKYYYNIDDFIIPNENKEKEYYAECLYLALCVFVECDLYYYNSLHDKIFFDADDGLYFEYI